MNRIDARRLKPGRVFAYGDSMWASKCTYSQRAVVVRVTEGGGIWCYDIDRGGRGEHCVPYHKVIEVFAYYHHAKPRTDAAYRAAQRRVEKEMNAIYLSPKRRALFEMFG